MQLFDMGCVVVIKRKAMRKYINNVSKSLVAYYSLNDNFVCSNNNTIKKKNEIELDGTFQR
jgi:hypothetical protein